jgi:hypothetical protein
MPAVAMPSTMVNGHSLCHRSRRLRGRRSLHKRSRWLQVSGDLAAMAASAYSPSSSEPEGRRKNTQTETKFLKGTKIQERAQIKWDGDAEGRLRHEILETEKDPTEDKVTVHQFKNSKLLFRKYVFIRGYILQQMHQMYLSKKNGWSKCGSHDCVDCFNIIYAAELQLCSSQCMILC